MMPTRDPEAFAEFVDRRFPGLDYKTENGRVVVSVEGRGYMPFDTLVRMGLIAKAKAVPMKDSQ